MIADMHVRPDRSPRGIDGGLMPVDDLIYLAPLRELAEVLLRGDSTLSRGEGELIAAYVSWLNGASSVSDRTTLSPRSSWRGAGPWSMR